jgi:3-oxoacyl-[acyl-carrier-protein] synthase-3
MARRLQVCRQGACRSGEEVCAKAAIATTAIDWLVPHQANIRIIEATGRKLASTRAVVVTVDRTVTPRRIVPLALDERSRRPIRRGQKSG